MQITALLLLVFAQLLQVHAQIEQNTVERYLQENRAAGNKPNSLIQQSSPYLLQHAYNPVHWYAWGEQAFELARKQNKPILLSIGYSTCYWCHVMAHESFENEKIASFLNKHFISIKLDREERPDIDDVYMAATELVNGYGGWPMTVFLNHDLEPFHAGVYYPPFSTDSSTGFYELLLKVSELWNKDRARIDLVAEQITSHIKAQADEVVAGASIDRDVLSEGFDQIADSYDEDYAGFGDAPKFPQPGAYAFLLSIAESKTENATSALQMLRQTLLAMSQGGLYDQVGGGFHRYSVDARWQVPHFEKMLYTQALMALAYTRLYEIEPDARYREVVTGTLQFVLDEMRHPQGAFYSALDASSERPDQPGEHAEGAYYLWRAADLRSALNKDEWEFIRRYFDIQDNGNIVSDPRGDFEKLNILYISEDYRQKKTVKKDSALLDSAKRRLGQQRLQRPRPHLDDKILVAWNGMMIRALVEAARVFKDQKYLDAAVAAAEFVQRHFIEAQNDVLYRRMRNDEVGIQANLVDYVWYVNGLLALYSQTGEKHWLQRAEKLTNKQVQLFHDAQSGGFYESATEKHVLFRSRSAYDGALPAPNAIAIENLYLLARLSGEGEWRQMAEKALASFAASINNNPVSAGWMLSLIGREQLTVKSKK